MRFVDLPVQQQREQFAKHVRIGFRDGCWRWTGSKTVDGYGQLGSDKTGLRGRAHRISYSLFVAAVPSELHVLHRCDNPGCVNPDHLFLGTPKINSDDKYAKGRARPRGKSQPPRGSLPKHDGKLGDE